MKTVNNFRWLLLLGFIEFAAAGELSRSLAAGFKTGGEPERDEFRYAGTWLTTQHKKLDGTIHCTIKPLLGDRWQGRFWGEWQRVPFDYTVDFVRTKVKGTGMDQTAGSGEATDRYTARGKALIDGADYDWSGDLTANEFNIVFTGSRYDGSVKMKRVPGKPLEKPDGAAAATARKTSLGNDAWRFAKHNGAWWYWMPGNYWAKWDGVKWKRHGSPVASNF